MRKVAVILFFIVPWTLFGGTVRQDYVFTTPVMNGGAVSMDGCHRYYGAYTPDIPAKSVRLLLPDNQIAESFEVSCDDPVALSGRFAVRPYRPEGRMSSLPPADYSIRKAATFSVNGNFPGKLKSDGFEIQHKAGHPIFMAQIYPVQYNPVLQTIRYYRKLTVTVRTRAARSNEQATALKATPKIRDELAPLVDNPDAITNITAGITVGADDYEYLIVTTEGLKGSFADYIAFNTRRGMRTKIATLDAIKSSVVAGADDQEKIRAYIKQEYKNCNINYVLLVGDVEANAPQKIPCRGLWAEDWDYGNVGSSKDHYTDNIPADMYYGGLDDAPHDWKKAGSTKYGEYGTEDKTMEVHVGRFCSDNATELGNMVNKTIKYSEQPVDSLCMRMLSAGEFSWGPPEHPVSCYGDDEVEQLIDTCNVTYGPTIGFPSKEWIIAKLYEKQKAWTGPTFISTVKSNKSMYINHTGHSNEYYLFKMSGSSINTNNFPQNCTPANGNYFISLSGGCYPGAFDNNNVGSISQLDCIAECLTDNMATGAVATIFNSRYGFASDGAHGVAPTDGSDVRLMRYFYHAIFGEGRHTIGSANDYSKEVNADKWMNSNITTNDSYFGQLKWETYQKNLQGDPALSVWTKKPQVLTVTLPSLSGSKFTVTVPGKYPVVALATTGDSIITSVEGDASGTVTIENDQLTAYLQAHPQGKLKAIIKAHNYYPYSGEVTVGTAGVMNGIAQGRFSAVMLPRGIKYTLAGAADVSVGIYDAKGALARKVTRQAAAAGEHFISLDGLRSGMYYCTMTAGNQSYRGKFFAVK